MKAVVFGEIIWDVYPDKSVIGGAPFNFGANLAYLGNEVYLVSAVGEDTLGERALEIAKDKGIKTDFIKKNGYQTGSCLVTLDKSGLPSYNVLKSTAYDNITADQDKIAEVNADAFYFNTLIQRSEASADTLKNILKSVSFKEKFCDINLRKDCFSKESLKFCLENSTIIKVSEEECHFIYDLGLLENSGDSFPKALAKHYENISLVVFTLGENGSEVYDSSKDILYKSAKPKPVKVVSTVGAGDCYGAVFLSEYMKNRDIPSAVKKATKMSSIVVSSLEAVPF